MFLAVADERHFGRAAAQPRVSQSRVSQAIKTLEVRIGGSLFDRTSRQVRLTPLGERMLADVRPAYDQLRHALEQTRERAAGIVGALKIGVHTSLNAGPYMVEIVRAFNARNPTCEVVMVNTGFVESPLVSLREGRVDLLANRLPMDEPDITIGPVLSRERRALLVSRRDPLARQKQITYDEIGDRAVPDLPAFPRTMMDAYIPPVTTSGRRLRRVSSRTRDEAVMRVVLGEVVHPTVESWFEHYAHPELVSVPITDLPWSETGLAWLTAIDSPRVQAFVETAREVLSQTELNLSTKKAASPSCCIVANRTASH